ncbi:UDP-N-acetylmuramoyl-tripeptide--D-alanyl-D-alanine ligase [Paracidobacterium acidisoli]|uniref:UDP-N-acetylmuramoyl-tripeptide--D-alanyl-D-alanine ligase n=1 Tax=Paracidobacterium acidisoli TaxID=2303751 RepID=A0A372IKU3_9BACT|nr:UDP-N-acetylmuramoyl-tripeptide--D-alanyl-D-alanine ligase [Paracidobacterium acidisoli]MBT9332934.1 UDP-N-acetylmuramoyl-tripeptide--D-alanyl-D-alanine ligase [Paracidobacterium acidisoli]
MRLLLEQIAHWCSGELRGGDAAGVHATGYSIDSRTVAQGDLFFAVRGERFDGHEFVQAALERGACAAVVAQEKYAALPEGVKDFPLITVAGAEGADAPLAALQQLAAAVRRHWGKRVVGITGSAGKTTTKEAVAAVLAARFVVLKSQGNLNNGFGLPLQLLKLEPEHEVAVIEMGMSAVGEIAALCRIAAPNWGVVTNVGNAHAENFADGIAGIARAKYELVASLPSDGSAFLNCDDAYVSQFGRDLRSRAVYFGRGPCADPRAEAVEALGAEGLRIRVRAGGRHAELNLHLPGEHNMSNALAAIAVGLEAGIPLETCCAALEELRPGDRRGEVLHVRGATVINDSYNSNPEALKAMIATLAGVPATRRILIAGEMLELGREAAALHAACGRAAAAAGIDIVIGVRGNAKFIVEAARELQNESRTEALFVETPEEAGAWMREHLREGDAVLLKASRGVRLEKALEAGIRD